MGDFMTNLWTSIFTPGPTPTLLIATNITFGALQILLAALLWATLSIHFVVLSFLCGGLWYAINWFAIELRAAQAAQTEKEQAESRHGKTSTADQQDMDRNKLRGTNRGGVTDEGEDGRNDEADDEGGETELDASLILPSTESTSSLGDFSSSATDTDPAKARPKFDREATITLADSHPLQSTHLSPATSSSTANATQRNASNARRRNVGEISNARASTGDLSTDSEWEKVDDER